MRIAVAATTMLIKKIVKSVFTKTYRSTPPSHRAANCIKMLCDALTTMAVRAFDEHAVVGHEQILAC